MRCRSEMLVPVIALWRMVFCFVEVEAHLLTSSDQKQSHVRARGLAHLGLALCLVSDSYLTNIYA